MVVSGAELGDEPARPPRHVSTEINDQPSAWARAAKLGLTEGVRDAFPERGQRVAIIGCGTSFFMAQSFAELRERSGHGETDAFPASEFPTRRPYDTLVALTRSGTTTEVLRLLRMLRERDGTAYGHDHRRPGHPGCRAGGSSRGFGFRRREVNCSDTVCHYFPGVVASLAGRRPYGCCQAGTIGGDRPVATARTRLCPVHLPG